ncbi:MAG: PHB depolymerase family esterase [Chitinophagaceae bacterium]|nr:PHB depolymerase family esterase [Chitinophagaceae bacterium]
MPINSRLIVLIISLLYAEFAFAQDSNELSAVNAFGNNPGNLKMFIYEPDHKPGAGPKPLVVVLHGCGQTAEEVARLTGWNKLADLHDFIVVYPQQKLLNNVSTCFNWFRNSDINKGEGESESIQQMIRYTSSQYPIDSSRIFITGLSAGGAMAVVMMATHPATFAAGAIFAGGAYKLATNAFAAAGVMAGTKHGNDSDLVQKVLEQNPQYTGRYPKLILYQGQNDLVVNHKNADILIRQWTGLNQCDDQPDKVERSFKAIPDIQRMEYNNRWGEVVIIFYSVDYLGHRVLVKPGDADDEGGQTGTYGADRGFHSTWQTALDFGLLK